MELAEDATAMGNPNAASDGMTAAGMLLAAVSARWRTCEINASVVQGRGRAGSALIEECRRDPWACGRAARRGREAFGLRLTVVSRVALASRGAPAWLDRCGSTPSSSTAEDAAPLARFWAAALGWRVAPYDDEELDRLAAKGSTTPRTIRA